MAKSRARSSFKPKLISVAVAACFATSTAFANPTGGVTTHGTRATITNPATNVLNVQTYSPQTIINWGSFSISVGELTRFMQPSAASAVLNRIAAGASPSSILGSLESNGRVFLINPNGITFGAGSQINVAGLVASTLNLTDADFLAGRMRFGDGLGKTLENQGNITTPAGGSVYLVGSAVTNNGIITSPNGEVILAAGNSVELVNPGTPNLRVQIAAADNEARNLGQIISDAGRIGIYAGLINNSGTIRADSVVSEGGRILLKASKSATLESTSVLSAQGQGGGEILVLADETTKVAGRLDASAPNGGDGGFIETSGKNVTIADSTVVTANAPYGRSGTWLIDPLDFVIAPQGGNISGTLLSGSLNQMSVVITSDGGTGGVNGDIFVRDQITWTASTSLTLLARRNVELSSSSISGGGDLAFFAGWDGGSTSSPLVTSGVGDITSSFDSIATRGNVYLEAGRDILLGASTVAAGSGAVLDSLSKTAQLVAGRNISLTDPEGGASVLATGINGSNATVSLRARTGAITMQGSELLAMGGGITSVNGGAAGVTLNAGSEITLNNSIVSAIGAGGISGGSGTAALFAGGGITLSGSTVSAGGGGGSSGAGGNATVTLSAGGDIALASAVNASSGAGSPAGTARIFLTFLTPTGNFSVNGVPGAIVDTSLGRVGEGFFVDGLPAILGVNFFVTSPSDAPVFNDILVATVNQQADVLADQLKAGEIGEAVAEEKKKLALCN